MFIDLISFIVIIVLNFIIFEELKGTFKNKHSYFDSEYNKKIIQLFSIFMIIIIIADYRLIIFIFTLIF